MTRQGSSWQGIVTPIDTPILDATVEDADRGCGIVTRRVKGGSIWVRFETGDQTEVLFTRRGGVGVYRAFPGPADAVGLLPL